MCALVLLCLLAQPALAAKFNSSEGPMEAYWWRGRIVVEAIPRSNEGYIHLARRLMADPDNHGALSEFNKNRPVMDGRPVALPLNLLRPELKGEVLRELYPEDELTERGWSHRVDDPLESLMQLTEAYTGSKRSYKELARFNKISNPDILRQGMEIVIPLEWIPDELGFRPVAVREPLALLKEKSGRMFATYVLRPNDTLYSLLIRFTDRERAEEINRMAGLLMQMNNIGKPTQIHPGKTIRFPIEWISEEFLGQGFAALRRPLAESAPREEKEQAAPAPAPEKKAGGGLGQVHVIVDAGHGGRDPGAVYGRRGSRDYVFEHEVVHDISLRLIPLLEKNGHRVYPVIEDTEVTSPVDRISTDTLGAEQVRVTPPYKMESANVAVNMRVFLINSLYRQLLGQGVPRENIVLISIHGDALAHTLRGAMAYYPDHRLRAREFAPRSRVYKIRKEALPSRISFTPVESKRSHEASREFAELLIEELGDHKLGVSRRKPVRSYFYRNGERTLPAVLRYSPVPVSVLVEVANLNNRSDRLTLLSPHYRQRLARGISAGVDAYKSLLKRRLRQGKSSGPLVSARP